MSPAPASPRLFRAEPHPAIKFEHATMEEAGVDAQKLRDYLEKLPVSRRSKRHGSYQEGD